MDKLYEQFIAGKQKAIVGFIFGFLATYFAKHGINFDTITFKVFLEQLIYGFIAYVGVYVKANK